MELSTSLKECIQGNKTVRARDERIATLETENAILHLQIAQLQNSFRSLLQRKAAAASCYRCQQCNVDRGRLLQLQQQVQKLKQNITDLHAAYKQLVHTNGMGALSTVLTSILHRHSCKLTEFDVLRTKYEKERKERKELHNKLIEIRGNIRVHCRVRPLLQTLIDGDSTECMKCIDDETVQVNHTQTSFLGSRISMKHFNFERVHGPTDSQEVVFTGVKPLITSLLDGFNVCIMAYGQTGGGKTYTMLGDRALTNSDQSSSSGVIPLAAAELFRLIKERAVNYEVTVTVVEIYNEQISDLLSQRPGNARHNVKIECSGDVEVTNVTERLVSSQGELLSLVSEGMKHRTTHSTNIHEHSSRSHLIVTIHITGPPSSCEEGGLISAASSVSSLQLNTTITPVSSTESIPLMSPISSPPKPRLIRSRLLQSSSTISSSALSCSPGTGSAGSSRSTSPRYCTPFHVKLQLVDLAGSECVGQSGVGGTNLREVQHINRSLCSLSDVLNALAEKRAHIPYRNSVLTHLLQDSIGGSAKMLMFLCLSPTSQHVSESLRVLGFGARARQIQRPQPAKSQT